LIYRVVERVTFCYYAHSLIIELIFDRFYSIFSLYNMEKLFWRIIGGILAIFLAMRFVPGVKVEVMPGESSFLGIELTEVWQVIVLLGILLGLINFFLKPVLDILTIPLKILTLGLFSLVLNMGFVWALDVFFKELTIQGILSLLLTTLLVWIVNFFLGF